MADEIAISRPAAVDSAAARPPAATSAITQLGSSAISGLASTMMSALTVSSLPFQPAASILALAAAILGLVVVVLDATVAVLVLELEQAGLLPALHPVRTGLVLDLRVGGIRIGVLHHDTRGDGADQVGLGHRGNGRRRGVEDGDEDQRPAGGSARGGDVRHGEEAHDHVRQTGGADHQRERVDEHVQRAAGGRGRVLAEAQIGHHLVQLGQQGDVLAGEVGAEAQLRDRVAGELHRDEDRRDDVGEDQHDVLGDLGVGDALHAAEHRVGEHDAHADVDADLAGDAEEAREGHADAGHLADDVGQRGDQQAEHRHRRGRLRVEAVADELRHGELAELAQVGGQQAGQQHVAAGPAHQEQAAAVAHVGDQAGHRDEGGG